MILCATSAQAQDARCDLAIERWAIHLEDIDLAAIAMAPDDLFIIDTSRTGKPEHRFTADEIAAAKIGPDGRRRLILAYLSVGQAEEYRAYWQEDWRTAPPAWLDMPDADWHDNHEVRFWHPGWQALVYGSPDALIDRALALGFDGAMLDGVDAFETWGDRRATAKDDMTAFVRAMAAHARARDPGFMLFPLNAENLLLDPGFAGVIDGIVKEDLFYGQDHRAQPNDPAMVDWSAKQLKLARDMGLPVLVLEYLPAGPLREDAAAKIAALGFLASFAERALGQLSDGHPASSGAAISLASGAACRAP